MFKHLLKLILNISMLRAQRDQWRVLFLLWWEKKSVCTDKDCLHLDQCLHWLLVIQRVSMFVQQISWRMCETVFQLCLGSVGKSNSLPSSLSFSGYSCRLVTHGMSLIIVNEDSLDVSRSSSSSLSPPFSSLCTYSIFFRMFVHLQ